MFANATAAYVYLLFQFRDKPIAVFGAVIFGFSGFIVGRSIHAGASLALVFPLSLYCLQRGLQDRRRHWLGICALIIAITSLTLLYSLVALLLFLAITILCAAVRRWRERRFWLDVAALGCLVAIICGLRAYPLLMNRGDLDDVLDKAGGVERENDLLQYFINYENPFFNRLMTNRVATELVDLPTPGRWNTSYLGTIPMILAIAGLLRSRSRRKMLPWLALLLPFLLLRLGSQLTINGHIFSDIYLPKHVLDELAPAAFGAFYSTDLFHMGALLPWAVAACYGLAALTENLPGRRRSRLILLLIALLAAEYYRSPEAPRIVPGAEIAHLDWLAGEADQAEIRLINLPMNRGNSKQYLFYQTLSGYPQVEGLATRTPPRAYDYIRANIILDSWFNKTSIVCGPGNREDYLGAVDQLARDGFTHVVLHYHLLQRETIAASFGNLARDYEDDYTAVFRLENLRASC